MSSVFENAIFKDLTQNISVKEIFYRIDTWAYKYKVSERPSGSGASLNIQGGKKSFRGNAHSPSILIPNHKAI